MVGIPVGGNDPDTIPKYIYYILHDRKTSLSFRD